MRWALAAMMMMTTMVRTGMADAGKPRPPKVEVSLALSASISSQAPVLKFVVKNPTPHEVELASVENPVCWVGLYFTGSLMKPDLTDVAEVKRCKDPGTKTFALASKASFAVEVSLEKLFRAIPKGTYELALQFDSAAATARDSKLTVTADTSTSALRFTVAKRLKTVTASRGTEVSIAKGVTLTFVSHGHKHMMEGSGPSPLLVAAKVAAGGKAEEVTASVHGKEPFYLGPHVFSIVDYAYDDYMKLDYWGRIKLAD